MLQDRPFRTTVQKVEDGEVARINRQEGYQHARKLEPAPKALERIRTQKHANRQRQNSWNYHPDERVPLRMVDLGYRCPSWEKLRRRLNRAAGERARQEGVLWTPLLDKIQRKRENRRWRGGRSPTQELLKELAEWLSNLDGPTPGRGLMQFQSRRVREVACRHISHVDTWWFQQAWGNPHLMRELAQNPATPETFTRRIEEYFLNEIKAWHRRDQQEEIKSYHKMQQALENARRGLEGVEKGPGLQAHTLNEAISLIPVDSNHYQREERESWIERKLRQELCLLTSRLEHNTPTYGQLLHLIRSSRPLVRPLQDILRHQDLPLKLIQHIAQDSDLSHWHAKLARHRDEVETDYKTRQALLHSPSTDTLQRMCQKARPEELSILVPRVAELLRAGKKEYPTRSGRAGSRLLHTLLDAQGENLTEEQLLELHQKVYKDSSTVIELITLPGAGPKLWKAALEGSPSIKIREALVNHPPARTAQPIWEQLMRSTSQSLLKDLSRQSQGKRLRAVLQKLLNMDIDNEYLQQFITDVLDEEQRRDIKPQDLQPLLQGEDARQRQKALRLLAQVGQEEDEPEPPAPTRARSP